MFAGKIGAVEKNSVFRTAPDGQALADGTLYFAFSTVSFGADGDQDIHDLCQHLSQISLNLAPDGGIAGEEFQQPRLEVAQTLDRQLVERAGGCGVDDDDLFLDRRPAQYR
jgi:hypothetical protein